MARQKAKSSLLGKALQSHAKDETKQPRDFIDLPPGIRSSEGIAQLVDAKVGIFKAGVNEGEQFVYLAGTVVAPKKVTYSPKVFADGKVQVLPPQTVEVVGQRTGVTYPLCDTTKGNGETVPMDEHVEEMLNMLRLLGGDTSTLKVDADLDALLVALVEEGPYFKFSTSGSKPTKDYPEPRTWENWHGSEGLEDYEPEDDDDVDEPDDDEVEDETEDEDEEAEDQETEEEDEEEDEDEDGEGEETLEELGIAADDDDEGSQAELEARAKKFSLDPEEFDTWASLATAIDDLEIEADESDADDEEEEDDDEDEDDAPFEPIKGGVCSYKPPKKKKAVDCEIKKVLSKAKTCDLQSLADGTLYKGVAWDLLSE